MSRKKPVTTNTVTQRWLRAGGYDFALTEQTIRTGRIVFKRDLFNLFDMIALRDGSRGIIGIQNTTRANLNSRVRKAFGHPQNRPKDTESERRQRVVDGRLIRQRLVRWLQAGNRAWFIGWAPPGKRVRIWRCTLIEIRHDGKRLYHVEIPSHEVQEAAP